MDSSLLLKRYDDLEKGSQALLQAMSFLDPGEIPEYILAENPAASTWPGYPSTSAEYQKSRTELIQRSLITGQEDKQTLTIDPLTQGFVRTRMTKDEYSKSICSMLSFISAVWPYKEIACENEMNRWARCQKLVPHVLKISSLALTCRFETPKKLTQDLLDGLRVIVDTASEVNICGRFDIETFPLLNLAESMYDALEAGIKDGSSSQDLHDQLLWVKLGILYERGVRPLHTNNPRWSLYNMLGFNTFALAEHEEKVPDIDLLLGLSWNGLGNAYLQNNDSIKAKNCFLESISCFKDPDGATLMGIPMPQISLGFVALIEGRVDDADEIFSKALAVREKKYGRDDKISFETGRLLLGYGNVKLAQGKLEESFELHKRCLEQYKSTVGDRHHRYADGCMKVASHYVRLGNFESALQLLDQAVEIYRAGGDSWFFAENIRARRTRARLLKQVGKLDEAKADIDIARDLWTKIWPKIWKDDSKSFEHLKDEDIDQRIMFWSR